jgi:hypothetical protein
MKVNALHYMREFFNKFSILIVYITALLCWLTCILIRKNELTSMESVEFHFHISCCFLSVNYKTIYEFYLHITYSLQILCDMHNSNECKHVNCCVWNWGRSVFAEYISACIHLVPLHYILLYKIHTVLHLVYTHIHTCTQHINSSH